MNLKQRFTSKEKGLITLMSNLNHPQIQLSWRSGNNTSNDDYDIVDINNILHGSTTSKVVSSLKDKGILVEKYLEIYGAKYSYYVLNK